MTIEELQQHVRKLNDVQGWQDTTPEERAIPNARRGATCRGVSFGWSCRPAHQDAIRRRIVPVLPVAGSVAGTASAHA